MKEYFSHDYHARTDRKMINLQMKHGMAGVGIYWCLIEIAYENNGVIPVSDCERITFELRTKYERIKSVLEDFDLFYTEDGFYHSVSIDRRLLERKEKSESARKSVNKRWEKTKDQDINTNVLRMYDERNTIKENKSIVNKSIVKNNTNPEVKNYFDRLLNEFKESYLLSRGVEYEVLTPGKENTALSKLQAHYKKLNPDSDTETAVQDFRRMFDACMTITDPWLYQNMSPMIITTHMNQIKIILQNGKPTGKNGATDRELAEIIAKHFVI